MSAIQGRGESNPAIGVVLVLIAVDRHINRQVCRTAEGDVAVITPAGCSVQVDVRPGDDADCAGCLNAAEIGLPGWTWARSCSVA